MRPLPRESANLCGGRRPLLWIATAFTLGILIHDLLPIIVWWTMATGGLAVAWLTSDKLQVTGDRSRHGGPVGLSPVTLLLVTCHLSLVAALVGLGAVAAQVDGRLLRDHYWRFVQDGACVVEGVVVSDPIWRIQPMRQEAVVAVRAVGPGSLRARGHLLVRHRRPSYPLRFGDRVRIQGVLRHPRPAANPDAFDEARWLWLRGVEGVVEAADGGLEWQGSAQGLRRIIRGLFDLKHQALERAQKQWDPLTASCVAALVAGDRHRLPRPIVELFERTGTVHLLSVSGWHVTLIGGLLWIVARIVRLPRRGAAVVTMLGLTLYCLLTGAEPPIVRATLTGLLVLIGLCFQRPADPLNTLAGAAFVILAWSPRTLWDIGFQLSFLSVAALLTLAPWGLQKTRGIIAASPRWGRGVVASVLQGLVVSTAVWCGIWPLVAHHWHRVTPIAWLANLAAVPLAALVMVTGLVVLLGVGWHPWLVLPWGHAAALATQGLVGVLRGCARLPGATASDVTLPAWVLLGWYAALLGWMTLGVSSTHFLNDPEKIS